MREISTEIVIRASAASVWAILVDLSHYHLWNPFIVASKGRVAVGERLECHPRVPGFGRPWSFRPTVTRVEPERLFAWQGHKLHPVLAGGEHIFEIEPLGSERIRFVHRQQFSGLWVPFLWRFAEARIRTGFERMNEAIKLRAEALPG